MSGDIDTDELRDLLKQAADRIGHDCDLRVPCLTCRIDAALSASPAGEREPESRCPRCGEKLIEGEFLPGWFHADTGWSKCDDRAAGERDTTEAGDRLVVAEALLNCFQSFFEGTCQLDHHGACQAHMGEDDGCTVAEAREWIAAARPAPVTGKGDERPHTEGVDCWCVPESVAQRFPAGQGGEPTSPPAATIAELMVTDCPECGNDAELVFPSALHGAPDFYEYECASCRHQFKRPPPADPWPDCHDADGRHAPAPAAPEPDNKP